MKTRTLLLLAVTCGIAILVAGMFVLLRLDHQTTAAPLGIGQQGVAGDALLFGLPMAVMALADTGAALVGRAAGETRYRVMDGVRSLEGSVTFFALAFALFLGKARPRNAVALTLTAAAASASS